MALTVRTRDIPKIPGAVKWYRVSAYITGVLLLALVVEMILKYTPLHLEMQLGGGQFFVPEGTAGKEPGTFNLSIGILIAHGWLYVLYLFTDFRLWSIMRWRPIRFLLIAPRWRHPVHVLRGRAPHAEDRDGHLPRPDRCPAA